MELPGTAFCGYTSIGLIQDKVASEKSTKKCLFLFEILHGPRIAESSELGSETGSDRVNVLPPSVRVVGSDSVSLERLSGDRKRDEPEQMEVVRGVRFV